MRSDIGGPMSITLSEEDRGRSAPGSLRSRRRWLVPSVLFVAYALFAAAVHLRLLDGLDLAVRHSAHDGAVWGPTQVRAAGVVDALDPTHVALWLLLFVAATSALRRSLRPFLLMILVALPVVVVTLGSKWVMAHWDPGTVPVGHGSFPSGHAASTLMAFGVVVLLVRPGTRWGWSLPAVMGGAMGVALILAWVHPATDVIGAGLLVAAVLAWAAAARLGQWANDPHPRTIARQSG
jgi:membrane-associated phospholipid phosphatase